jgi:hypothetical protein
MSDMLATKHPLRLKMVVSWAGVFHPDSSKWCWRGLKSTKTNYLQIGNWAHQASTPIPSRLCNKEMTMETLLDVVKVKARQGHLLDLEFENGEKRVFDMQPYLDKRPFNQLKNSPLFDLASVGYGTVIWPGNLDIAPETLYDRSIPA